MSDAAEIGRIDDVPGALDFHCIRCGKEVRLWFNGGELDQRSCCGLTYSTEIGRVDFIVRGEPQPGDAEKVQSMLLLSTP